MMHNLTYACSRNNRNIFQKCSIASKNFRLQCDISHTTVPTFTITTTTTTTTKPTTSNSISFGPTLTETNKLPANVRDVNNAFIRPNLSYPIIAETSRIEVIRNSVKEKEHILKKWNFFMFNSSFPTYFLLRSTLQFYLNIFHGSINESISRKRNRTLKISYRPSKKDCYVQQSSYGGIETDVTLVYPGNNTSVIANSN
uniref:Uncharacterized protein n=1 Tax=Glossina brevipalpis TaxID=37001 RepID=A0A1A9W1L5_9MUSC